jgi:catechol 2,3-dioxygenase-like lactoylglutathione lyase family enzyme
MLNQLNAMATVPVKDMAVAKRFYEGTLGLVAASDTMGAITYKSGDSQLIVYESPYAGSNQATAVTWRVGGEVDDIVRMLRAKGVTFEHYDVPEGKREGDIHIAGNLRMAWLKDPTGNILALVSG